MGMQTNAQVVNSRCTRTDIDLIFTRIKAKGKRKINFATFKKVKSSE